MADKYAIYGTGGCARDAVGPLVQSLTDQGVDSYSIVFVDDDPAQQNQKIHGHAVLDYTKALQEKFRFCIAIASAEHRRALAERIANDGGDFFSIRAPSYSQYANVEIGDGALLSDHVTVTADVQIGAHFHANYYSYVAHDCRIGDYVTLAPRVCCNGNVEIENGAYIGTGAMLRQGVKIGANAVVGMGAVVVADVPAGTTVVGNPARAIDRTS